MKNIKKQGFTLVELIVVITILAILGSIAFISLQGYSADARNSKRNSDLGSIQSAMSSQLAQGQSILSFVSNHNNTTTGGTAGISLAGTGIILGSYTEYDAGTVNYASLPVKEDDFKDPSANKPYVVGVTTRNDGKYELAATIEQGAGSKVAKIIGDYNPRKTQIAIGVKTGAVNTDLILTGSTSINYFFPGDYVSTGTTTPGYKISKISKDGTTLTFESSAIYVNGSLYINKAETPGLINNESTTATSTGDTVTEGQSTHLPYSW